MVTPELSPATSEDVVPSGDHELRAFLGLDLTGRDGSDGRLLECTMTDCRADDLALNGTRVLDCSVDTLAATTLTAARGTWGDVTLTGCRIGVLDAPTSTWTDVTVRSGKIDFLNLRAATLTRVRFEDCWLGEVRFGGAGLEHVVAVDCRIDSLELRGATAAEVDLREARLGRHDGVEHLRGVRISAGQLVELAPALAAHVGLLVGDAPAPTRARSRGRRP